MPRKPQTALALSGAAFLLAATPGCPKEEPPVLSATERVPLRPCIIEEVIRFERTSIVNRQVLKDYTSKLPKTLRGSTREQRTYDSDEDGRADCETTVDIGPWFVYEIMTGGPIGGRQEIWYERYTTQGGGITAVTWSVVEIEDSVVEVKGWIDHEGDGTQEGAFLYRRERNGTRLRLEDYYDFGSIGH